MSLLASSYPGLLDAPKGEMTPKRAIYAGGPPIPGRLVAGTSPTAEAVQLKEA